jgi:hypothetical protein
VRFVAKLRTIWPHLWQSRMALAGLVSWVKGKPARLSLSKSQFRWSAESLEKYARSQGNPLVAFKDFPTKCAAPFPV